MQMKPRPVLNTDLHAIPYKKSSTMRAIVRKHAISHCIYYANA